MRAFNAAEIKFMAEAYDLGGIGPSEIARALDCDYWDVYSFIKSRLLKCGQKEYLTEYRWHIAAERQWNKFKRAA